MNLRYKEALNEVSQIISRMSEDDRNKINRNFLKFIVNNKSKFGQKIIYDNIDLNKQEISDEAKAILYIIVNKYLK